VLHYFRGRGIKVVFYVAELVELVSTRSVWANCREGISNLGEYIPTATAPTLS